MNEPTRCNTGSHGSAPRISAESCPIARSLEIVGERWTLLIMRDAFYGTRRFSDFEAPWASRKLCWPNVLRCSWEKKCDQGDG